MIIKVDNQQEVKTYLKNFHTFKFDSLLHLVFELFYNNTILDTETDDILYEHITSLGYEKINQISPETKKILEKWYYELSDAYLENFDVEKQSYLLLAKIVDNTILVTIDSTLISNYQVAISIKKDSVITFTNLDKINTINFTTI